MTGKSNAPLQALTVLTKILKTEKYEDFLKEARFLWKYRKETIDILYDWQNAYTHLEMESSHYKNLYESLDRQHQELQNHFAEMLEEIIKLKRQV